MSKDLINQYTRQAFPQTNNSSNVSLSNIATNKPPSIAKEIFRIKQETALKKIEEASTIAEQLAAIKAEQTALAAMKAEQIALDAIKAEQAAQAQAAFHQSEVLKIQEAAVVAQRRGQQQELLRIEQERLAQERENIRKRQAEIDRQQDDLRIAQELVLKEREDLNATHMRITQEKQNLLIEQERLLKEREDIAHAIIPLSPLKSSEHGSDNEYVHIESDPISPLGETDEFEVI